MEPYSSSILRGAFLNHCSWNHVVFQQQGYGTFWNFAVWPCKNAEN